MVKSEKKIFALEIILSLILLLNIFVKSILNDYLIILIIIASIILILWQVGYEKDKNIDNNKSKKIIKYIIFYNLSFIILQYGLGFILDYIKTPYKINILTILSNIFSTIIIIFSSEFLRYMIIKKGEKKKIIQIICVILFILIDLSLNIKLYDLSKLSELLEFSTSIFLPSFFKNLVLTIFTYRYGIKQNIVYRLILELYIYIIPITPDLGTYLKCILSIIYPLLIYTIITYGFEKEKKKDYRINTKRNKIVSVIIIIFISSIIALNSNLFRYWIVAVASGSMEPTINVGDMIIVDKSYKDNINKLKVGDILVFKIGKKIYTHRIIDIKHDNNNYNISTKGDRKGQMKDSWTVTNKNVIGVVKLKIRYIGHPTVWLSRILEESNE